MSFSGFPPAGLDLLTRLPSLDSDGFAAERAGWEELLLQPARQFVTDLGAALAERVSPGLVADPRVNGSIAPINRDLRFDPHGPRYKDHLLFRWWEGAPKKTAPTLFTRLDPTRIAFASGLVFASVDRWRAAVGNVTAADTLVHLIGDIRCATLSTIPEDPGVDRRTENPVRRRGHRHPGVGSGRRPITPYGTNGHPPEVGATYGGGQHMGARIAGLDTTPLRGANWQRVNIAWFRPQSCCQ